MRTIETKVYTFDELTDSAKEKARDWYRQGGLDYEWWDTTYEDAEMIGLKISGFDLRGLCDGEFIGTALETVNKIKENHGDTCETYKTAIRYEQSLRDTLFASEKDTATLEDDDAYENSVHEFLLDLLEDYRIILEKELEYIISAESVDENIRANEYEFTENGMGA